MLDRLSEGEIRLRHFLESYLGDIPYYKFSADGPVLNRPLSARDYHGLRSAWCSCALLMCTSKNLLDLFGPKRIATHYSDQQDRWLFVHQAAAMVVFRSQAVETGETGEVQQKCRDVRRSFENLSILFNPETSREFPSYTFSSRQCRKRKLDEAVVSVIEGTTDFYFTTQQRDTVRIHVPPPLQVAIISMEIGEDRVTQAMCKHLADSVRTRKRICIALEELKFDFPSCLDARLMHENEGARILRHVESVPGLHILLGIVGAQTIREWVNSTCGDVQDDLHNLMNE
jgi:hypothetical protein